MSFARWVLRTAAVQALRGQTLVGDNVRDSDFSALTIDGDGEARTEEDRPFILVYTDDGDAADVDLRDLRQNGTTAFVCEFGIASPMVTTNPDTGESVIEGINIPFTDAAMELTLDLIDRQITTALTGPGRWADIWRRTHGSTKKIERRRTSTSDHGVRLAARQLRIMIEALPDPVPGQDVTPTSVWRLFSDAVTELNPAMAEIVNKFLGVGLPYLDHEIVASSRGNTAAEALHLGYGPIYPGGDDLVSAVTDE
ncbi:hypothetical protein SAMN05444339_10272 [Loktanella atrilutea]|uniref:Uncharacterized protein n=1 Tax=Loktanella atrilutea TaxID=366533 RepID=A0A1M4WCY3_LOKAT|nr:hypothetical protein [Loktanella atrilutea]SHE79099.1 hypothetical protein SAMN05444339_10272 [Loktanella atrilutea]